MRNKRYIFTILAIIVIFIAIIIIFNIIRKSNEVDTIVFEPIPEVVEQEWEERKNKILSIDDCNYVVELKYSLEIYFDALNNTDEANKEIAFSCLAKDYVDKRTITKNSIILPDSDVEYESSVEIYKSFMVTRNNGSDLFFVSGLVRNMRDYSSEEFNLAVVLDSNNETFEIYPKDYFEDNFFDNLKSGEVNELDYPDIVEDRQYNRYNIVETQMNSYYNIIFENVRRLISYDIENAYKYLNKDVSEIKSIGEINSFYDSNRKSIFLMNFGNSAIEKADINNKVIKLYDSNDEIVITVYFEGYGTYLYDIGKI